jgi:hypothetical protein
MFSLFIALLVILVIYYSSRITIFAIGNISNVVINIVYFTSYTLTQVALGLNLGQLVCMYSYVYMCAYIY